ncbi:hypothetical protein B0H11DRAFT_2234033 [Mycena galericulata]|nr:hypothetical protein B0H11DRAFT_2234033 [Mycena galericulata]
MSTRSTGPSGVSSSPLLAVRRQLRLAFSERLATMAAAADRICDDDSDLNRAPTTADTVLIESPVLAFNEPQPVHSPFSRTRSMQSRRS